MNFATFKKLTRIEQTFFGLPFILSGTLLPFLMQTLPWYWKLSWLWIIPAFISGRISGMIFNQTIDHKIDARNPRTSQRVVASGVVNSTFAFTLALLFLLLFLLFCSQINLLTFYFSIPAALLVFFYSYTKRVTSLCHFVLGMIHFLGPFMAWVAIMGTICIPPILLSLVSASLMSGMDIIYAIQDVDFDKKEGLYSIPARWGVKSAQIIALTLHLLSAVFLVLLGLFSHFNLLYYLAPLIAFFTFILFHLKVSYELRLHGKLVIEPLFFYCTLIVSFSTLLFILLGFQ